MTAQAGCELVLFAGDLVSTFAVPPLRRLKCPFVGCFGDNEGNKVGLLAGFSFVGRMDEPPVRLTAPDGTRMVVTTASVGATAEEDAKRRGKTRKPAPAGPPDSDYRFIDRLGYMLNGAGFVYDRVQHLWLVDMRPGKPISCMNRSSAWKWSCT